MLQFLLGLSDRQAAEAVRCRIDFKYAMALDLGDSSSTRDSSRISPTPVHPTASTRSRMWPPLT
ncbi:transposase [Streptomyces sp. NPDC007164]|uniref:transposase n=1 Tax=Streptomyces sp. NPDC007164 TaxID=3156918 RepID=UPI0033F22A97